MRGYHRQGFVIESPRQRASLLRCAPFESLLAFGFCWRGGEVKELRGVAAHIAGPFAFLLLPLCFETLNPLLLS